MKQQDEEKRKNELQPVGGQRQAYLEASRQLREKKHKDEPDKTTEDDLPFF